MSKENRSTLAIFGGSQVRPQGMPNRLAYGDDELKAVQEVFRHYREIGMDFGYQGHFEELYAERFVAFQEEPGGYADAVDTGTASVFVALAALQLPKGSEIIVPPMTDAGPLSAVIINQLVPVVVDSDVDSYNMSPEAVARKVSSKTGAILATHGVGQSAKMDDLMAIAGSRSVPVVEDCSQAHGARFAGKRVGTFGEISAFSTMYRKNHGTGGCGGVVYTRNLDRHRLGLAYADRGKSKWVPGFDDKNVAQFMFPALNFNQDELSCAIGIQTLRKLPGIIDRRYRFVKTLTALLAAETRFCRAYPMTEADSPFFLPVFVDVDRISCAKIEFAKAVQAEGIVLNPHYGFMVAEWPWVWPYLSGGKDTPNALSCRNRSFNILLNENYGQKEAEDIVAAILKAEAYYAK